MTVLVIGASRGIGLEFVRQYIDAGQRVIATARDTGALQNLESMGARALRIDVAQPASISALGWQLDGEKIDVALYVAGVFSKDAATTPPTQEAFDHVLHANVLGAMQAIPQVAPCVEEADGVFAFVTSAMGQIGGVESSYGWIYRVSKAALNMAVASAQSDYPRATLVAISPGWVQTDMGGASAPLTVPQSVGAMRKALAEVAMRRAADAGTDARTAPPQARKGCFLNYDGTPFSSW